MPFLFLLLFISLARLWFIHVLPNHPSEKLIFTDATRVTLTFKLRSVVSNCSSCTALRLSGFTVSFYLDYKTPLLGRRPNWSPISYHQLSFSLSSHAKDLRFGNFIYYVIYAFFRLQTSYFVLSAMSQRAYTSLRAFPIDWISEQWDLTLWFPGSQKFAAP